MVYTGRRSVRMHYVRCVAYERHLDALKASQQHIDLEVRMSSICVQGCSTGSVFSLGCIASGCEAMDSVQTSVAVYGFAGLKRR